MRPRHKAAENTFLVNMRFSSEIRFNEAAA